MNKKHISVDSNLSVYDPNQNTHRLLIFIHTLFLIKNKDHLEQFFKIHSTSIIWDQIILLFYDV